MPASRKSATIFLCTEDNLYCLHLNIACVQGRAYEGMLDCSPGRVYLLHALLLWILPLGRILNAQQVQDINILGEKLSSRDVEDEGYIVRE